MVGKLTQEDSIGLAYIAPVISGLVLVHNLPGWLTFVKEDGVVDDVSISLAEQDGVEMLLHLVSVPVVTICFLSSLMILHVQTKLAAPPGSTTASLTPLAQVTRARMPGQVVRARIALEPAQDPQDFELSHEKEDSSLDKNVPVACAISMPKPKADDDLVDHTFAELLRQGILAEKDLDVRKAVELYERALEERPSHRGTQLQLCKVKCDLGFLIFDTTHDGPMKQFFTCQSHETLEIATDLVSNALTEAKQLTEEDPEDHTAFTLLALCTGRQILLETHNKAKVSLAKQMHDAAQQAIALNPKDDQAHFMLARWHNDIASLPSFLKTLVRFIYGSSLKGTFDHAIKSSQEAIALNPNKIVNKVELGRAYTGIGDLERAKQVYKEVLHLEVEDVNAALYRQLAVDDIERMEQGKPVGSLARPWWAIGG